ncbi:MAG: hypothetical protein ACI91T_002163 [Natronomonas sp.]
MDFERFASETQGYAGSDIGAVCREPSKLALDEFIESAGAEKRPEDVDEASGSITVDLSHFEAALETVKPSRPNGGKPTGRWRSASAAECPSIWRDRVSDASNRVGRPDVSTARCPRRPGNSMPADHLDGKNNPESENAKKYPPK